MSGQPYKYHTDPTKFRTEYMETLGLQADINSMNLEANKTYKATGQLPAVSQMSDTRTTSEILADTEKLKIDLIQTIAKTADMKFGQEVVQRIMNNPLNSDNKLLIFAAQRIDDIVNNVRKLYKYGIKGDSNDVEQFVDFIATMYNDKNAIAAQTKSFMNRYGMTSLNNKTPFAQIYENLVKVGATVRNYSDEVFYNRNNGNDKAAFTPVVTTTELGNAGTNIIKTSKEIVDYIATLLPLVPVNPNIISTIEKNIISETQKYERGDYEIAGVNMRADISGAREEVPRNISPNAQKQLDEDLDLLKFYLDFLNSALPSGPALLTIIKQLANAQKNAAFSLQTLFNNYSVDRRNLVTYPSYQTALISYKKWLEVLNNLKSAIQVNDFWNIPRLEKLKNDMDDLFNRYGTKMSGIPQQTTTTTPQQTATTTPQQMNFQTQAQLMPPNPEKEDHLKILKLMRELERETQFKITADSEKIDLQKEGSDTTDLEQEIADIERHIGILTQQINNSIQEYEDTYEKPFDPNEFSGNGIGIKKRRGRPKGSGISKPKTYKESVAAHSVLDRGIMETPRFIKFGKYLINTHKLNNEDIFALKRPSGGNIVEIPSIKISKNLSGVIKKMVGGEIPTYSDISKLSEPEKAYLHKVSQKSNILDKFDIPAPSKNEEEKDIHQFEVMRGEILAGNDNKELIKKFKVHIMKMSKNGTLPKRETQEILEELLELGY